MNKLIRYILFAILIFTFIVSKAQLFSEYNFKFKTYTSNEGLVHNSVKKCLSDSKGFLWIITENGLSRFDGYQFKNFQHINKDSSSLPANDLSDIVIDNQDRIWLAYHSGLCYYDPANQHFKIIYTKGQPISASLLSYVKDENLLLLVTANGLLKYNIVTKKIYSTSLTKIFSAEPTCVMADNKNNIWIGIEQGGYFIYNIKTDTSHYFYDTRADTVGYFKTYDWPTNIYQDKAGTIYMSTWVNAFKIIEPDGRFNNENVFHIPVQPVIGLSYIYRGCTESEPITGKDILWVVTESGGVALFSKQQNKFVHSFRYKPELINGIKTDFNNSIYTAPDGTVWISTWHGLTKVNRQSQEFRSAELPELNSSHYNCITGLMNDPHDNDKVWMSVDGSGIAQYSFKKQQLVQWYFHDVKDPGKGSYYKQQWCVNLVKDSTNSIWSASYGGLVKIKNGLVSFKATPDIDNTFVDARGIYKDKNEKLWLYGDFLQRFDPFTEKYQSWYLSKNKDANPFYGVAESLNGNMFVATKDGLFDFDINKAVFKPVDFWKTLAGGAAWKNTRSVQVIGNKLYIGTLHGLVEMDMQTLQVAIIGEKEQITRIDFAALHKDAFNKLWIYSGEGVYRYDPISHDILKFSSADGIYNSSNDPAYFFEYNNDLFIGYRAAYTRFNPALVNNNNHRPDPYITEIQAGGSYLPINTSDYTGKSLSLDYSKSSITFNFTAIEYNNPEKISFSYMLQGFDNNWIEAGNKRSADYTNLPGGEFIFKVKAYNSSGLSSEQVAGFRIKIIPPFWKTWWFFGLILLSVSVISILISRWLLRRKQEFTKMNEQVARVELASLRSQMNPHFIFNSLNSIHKYIWENKPEDASEYLTKFSKLVRMILENSKEKEIPLSKELESLQLYIELEHRRCNSKFDYSITVDPSIDSSNVLIPSMIIQPYVENAIWHGLVQKNGNGILTISIVQDTKQITCTIEDDGIGRKKAAVIKAQKQDIHKSLGMDITAERLHLLSRESSANATVQIIDIEEGTRTGTKVILQLPLNMMF